MLSFVALQKNSGSLGVLAQPKGKTPKVALVFLGRFRGEISAPIPEMTLALAHS
jgi:hypothetical protein